MIVALGLALAVAAVNVVGAWALDRWVRRAQGRGYAWLQALGFFARFCVIFGSAHALWRWRGRAAEAAVLIVTAAVAQMVGLVYFVAERENV